MAPPSAALQTWIVLGLFGAVLVAGPLGFRPAVPFLLQAVEVALAVVGVLWAGHRGSGMLEGLGLVRFERQGALLAVLGATPMALGLVGGDPAAADDEGWKPLLTNVLTGAVLAPIGEELLFRGYAVRRLLDAGWSRGRAFLAPGLLFGLFHVPGALDHGVGPAVTSGLITAAGGIWYGWLFVRWNRSVWVPLLAHMAMNTWWIVGSVGPVAGSGGWLPNLGRGLAIALITLLTLRWTREKSPE
jgi:membrane protease YdiL (CAAX protease family)